jgi:hypothetical protein
MSDLDEFNLQILQKGGEVAYDPSAAGQKYPPHLRLRPIKSDHELLAKSLGGNVKHPRDRTYAHRGMNKFESLKAIMYTETDRNIFKKVH